MLKPNFYPPYFMKASVIMLKKSCYSLSLALFMSTSFSYPLNYSFAMDRPNKPILESFPVTLAVPFLATIAEPFPATLATPITAILVEPIPTTRDIVEYDSNGMEIQGGEIEEETQPVVSKPVVLKKRPNEDKIQSVRPTKRQNTGINKKTIIDGVLKNDDSAKNMVLEILKSPEKEIGIDILSSLICELSPFALTIIKEAALSEDASFREVIAESLSQAAIKDSKWAMDLIKSLMEKEDSKSLHIATSAIGDSASRDSKWAHDIIIDLMKNNDDKSINIVGSCLGEAVSKKFKWVMDATEVMLSNNDNKSILTYGICLGKAAAKNSDWAKTKIIDLMKNNDNKSIGIAGICLGNAVANDSEWAMEIVVNLLKKDDKKSECTFIGALKYAVVGGSQWAMKIIEEQLERNDRNSDTLATKILAGATRFGSTLAINKIEELLRKGDDRNNLIAVQCLSRGIMVASKWSIEKVEELVKKSDEINKKIVILVLLSTESLGSEWAMKTIGMLLEKDDFDSNDIAVKVLARLINSNPQQVISKIERLLQEDSSFIKENYVVKMIASDILSSVLTKDEEWPKEKIQSLLKHVNPSLRDFGAIALGIAAARGSKWAMAGIEELSVAENDINLKTISSTALSMAALKKSKWAMDKIEALAINKDPRLARIAAMALAKILQMNYKWCGTDTKELHHWVAERVKNLVVLAGTTDFKYNTTASTALVMALENNSEFAQSIVTEMLINNNPELIEMAESILGSCVEKSIWAQGIIESFVEGTTSTEHWQATRILAKAAGEGNSIWAQTYISKLIHLNEKKTQYPHTASMALGLALIYKPISSEAVWEKQTINRLIENTNFKIRNIALEALKMAEANRCEWAHAKLRVLSINKPVHIVDIFLKAAEKIMNSGGGYITVPAPNASAIQPSDRIPAVPSTPHLIPQGASLFSSQHLKSFENWQKLNPNFQHNLFCNNLLKLDQQAERIRNLEIENKELRNKMSIELLDLTQKK